MDEMSLVVSLAHAVSHVVCRSIAAANNNDFSKDRDWQYIMFNGPNTLIMKYQQSLSALLQRCVLSETKPSVMRMNECGNFLRERVCVDIVLILTVFRPLMNSHDPVCHVQGCA